MIHMWNKCIENDIYMPGKLQTEFGNVSEDEETNLIMEAVFGEGTEDDCPCHLTVMQSIPIHNPPYYMCCITILLSTLHHYVHGSTYAGAVFSFLKIPRSHQQSI